LPAFVAITILLQSGLTSEILPVRIQILFLGKAWIDVPLPSLICVPTGYQEQGKYSGYSYYNFYPIFSKSQQTVFLSSFGNNVCASCHLYDHMIQTHSEFLLLFEPFQPLPILITTMYRQMSLQLLVLSRLDIEGWNPLAYHILVAQCTFFQSVF